MEIVLPFDKLPLESLASTGGKGSTLACLCQAGHPVPGGLVILPALAVNPDWCRDTRRRIEAMPSKEKLATRTIRPDKPSTRPGGMRVELSCFATVSEATQAEE